MRDYKGMKRQRGRNRSGGPPQGGGGKPGQNANRAFESNGPDNIKVRGHAQHVYEKYQQLARDATTAGDPVLAENHLQHAEHYFRTLRVLQPNRPVTELVGRDTFGNGFDLDFEDEAVETAMEEADAAAAQAPPAAAEADASAEARPYAERAPRAERPAYERNDRLERGDRPAFDRDRQPQETRERFERPERADSRDRQEREPRQDRTQEPRLASDAPRERQDRPDRQDRGDRPRFEARREREPRGGEDRPVQPQNERGERNGERRFERDRGERTERGGPERGFDRAEPRTDTAAMVAPASATPPPSAFEPAEPEAASVLRGQDGMVSEAPAFLSAAPTPAPAAATGEEGEPRRPRGRPRRRRAEEGEAGVRTEPAAAEDA